MSVRPIILQGSEKLERFENPIDQSIRFDGSIGVWRDSAGRLAIRGTESPSTMKTATREGIDQSEGAGFSATTFTETREGVDQSERVG